MFALKLYDEAPPKKTEFPGKPFPLPTLVVSHKGNRDEGPGDYKELSGAGAGTEVNSLTSYLKDVYKNRLLTKEEEEELAIRISRGDQEATNRMIRSNLRLVINLAKKFLNSGMAFQDLIQEGNIGLMEAVEKFDHTKGCRFATYATWWIRQAIMRAIANQAKLIRLPVHILEVYRKYQQIVTERVKHTGEAPSVEEVSRILFPVSIEKVRKKMTRSSRNALKVNEASIRLKIMELERDAAQRLAEIVSIANDPVSLEAPLSDEHTCIADLLPAECTPMTQITDMEMGSLFSHITDREKKILALRYGFIDGVAKTLNEISKEFGISKERIRQKEDDALKKLRRVMIRKDWM